jgi:beta-xylosidase
MKLLKPLLLFAWAALFATSLNAQVSKPLPALHVEGKWLCDTHGNHVVLHGVMDTPSMWFNGYFDENGDHHSYWSGGYNADGANNCKDYFEKIFTALEKAKCDVFRLHLDPAWTNDPRPDSIYIYPGSEGQAEGVGGEASIRKFNPNRLKTYLTNLYWPLIQKAIDHKMYVVVRPPGVCPGSLRVGDYYNQYLMTVWDMFTQNANVKKYAGQVSIELANEPVSLKNADGEDDPKALHDFFQPIVDKIRANGFSGIIWAPGTGWQANYTSYETYPIEGANIGYAVHDYCGWYDTWDGHHDPQNKINQFKKQVPVVDTAPIIITEVDWSPKKEGTGHYDEHGNWVESNYGTWATGSTSKWGMAYKAMLDHYGNISMTLSGTHCLIDVLTLLKTGKVEPAFGGLEEACGKACMDWYADYYNVDWAHPDFKNTTYSDQGDGNYKNPLIFADFPDPDVIRVEDTYYMISTTMHNFPGATILKSKDLVNWEYCAQPLEQLSQKDRYSLIGNENAYAAGMWACSMTWHDGKFYILINGNDAGGFVLSATDPEGKWEKKQLPRIYYDPGMLFDNGKVYVACGIGNIQICELDEDFNLKREQTVIRNKDGLEGSHLYKIGNYYYIYATYGGWPSGQAIFRSENIFGPYEERMLVEKIIDNKPNTVHQGALVETQTGEWWTILQEDLGAFGRMPNLQPVTWEDGWPIVGNNGKPYATHAKPNTGTFVPRIFLPTNDTFRSYQPDMQWQWNHNPDNGYWSMIDRMGWLRLRTCGSANRLTQARNILTQRIFGLHSKPSQASMGTIRLDVSNLQEGDRAGICILQDPYAAIAVEVKDGKKQLVWWQDTLRVDNSFTPSQKTQEIEIDSVIYLRAAITYNTSKTQFSYSLNNKTFTQLGDQTTLRFNLTVFVGARFGLFCYNTGNGSGGYADFDWFSTEKGFEESTFFPSEFEGYSPEMLTAEKIEMEGEEMEVMIGNNKPIKLTATFADGHTEDVSAKAEYKADVEGVVATQGGMIRGLAEGSTNVTATYTDPLGNKLQTTTSVQTSFFPLASEFINTSLFSQGTFIEKSHTFRFGEYGQMGWEYSNGADMSGYKYLVVNLTRAASGTHLNIFTAPSIWSDCCESPNFGNKKQIVVDLQTATYTSGDKAGQPLDTKNVRIVSFWNNKGTLLVKDMYLTNNDDYTRSIPDGIEDLAPALSLDEEAVYDIAGRKVTNGSLHRGIYIQNGRKIAVK